MRDAIHDSRRRQQRAGGKRLRAGKRRVAAIASEVQLARQQQGNRSGNADVQGRTCAAGSARARQTVQRR
eukprot:15481523-Alexandrium_andersonii.AAC.1